MKEVNEWRVGKNSEITDRGLFQGTTLNLPGGNEKKKSRKYRSG
jgi:hypothetical protein